MVSNDIISAYNPNRSRCNGKYDSFNNSLTRLYSTNHCSGGATFSSSGCRTSRYLRSVSKSSRIHKYSHTFSRINHVWGH